MRSWPLTRWIQLALGIVISLACLVLAARGIDLRAVARSLGGAAYGWLAPALALYFAGVWVRSVRWQHLLWPVQRVGAARLFPVVVIGYMANDVLPFRLGEVARCLVLRRREGIAQTAALGTVLLERLMDGLTMLAFMGATLPFLTFSAELYGLMGAAGVLFLGVTLALVLLVARPVLAQRLIGIAVRPLPGGMGKRIAGLATTFIAGLASLGGATATLRVFALSCAAWLLEAGMYYTLMFAFAPSPGAGQGLVPSLPLAVLTTAVANLGSLIPSSPGYVGVFHAAALLVLVPLGVPRETALAYTVVVHAALVIPVTLLGFVYAAREGLALNRLAAVEKTA